ncbi:ABC transporter G family member 33-like [Dendrobium catenatum]|uniref:ABC transporter G family member 33-like n=1 Tax=Dendrobium catenatum TaxID=906689 RepID=UPI00109FDF0C|nr:ABC transporter G family member 33-like [Dendrobium catenatum]
MKETLYRKIMILAFYHPVDTMCNINMTVYILQLILIKKGGRVTYSGPLGQNSQKVIEYFERIPGVPKIKDNYNPATWMLEVTSAVVEEKLGIDFAHVYKDSSHYWDANELSLGFIEFGLSVRKQARTRVCPTINELEPARKPAMNVTCIPKFYVLLRDNKRLVEQLIIPPQGSSDHHFIESFSHIRWLQFKTCLWKLSLSYWRSPTYNLCFICRTNEQDLFSILGSMYLAMMFLGINNCSSVLQIIARERAVMYRELCAGTYSSFMYSLAQVIVEIPCLFILATIYVLITYPAVGYYWSASKIMWYYYIVFCTLLCFNYLGMLIMSVSPNIQVASVLAAATYTILNLFSGFLIPKLRIPTWWKWLYYICPTAWSLNGLLTSQYGDLTNEMMAFGKTTTVDAFLRDYYGFDQDQLSIVAITMAYLPLVLASLFSCCIRKINFQRR